MRCHDKLLCSHFDVVAFEADLVVAKHAYETISFLWTNLVCLAMCISMTSEANYSSLFREINRHRFTQKTHPPATDRMSALIKTDTLKLILSHTFSSHTALLFPK